MKINNYNTTSFGNRKIPRYIYHFTNEYAYKSMCEDGFIKATTKDKYIKEKSVFFVEMENFCKRWGKNKSWEAFPESLQESLLMYVAYFNTPSLIQDKNKLVILKISTDKLNLKKLFIRSQNRFFENLLSHKDTKSLSFELKECLEGNISASKSKIYKNRKEAIEYIYKDDIPIEKAKQIGQILDINSLNIDTNNQVKAILQMCLKGEPEELAMNNLKT